MLSRREKAIQIIKENRYLTLATNAQGDGWVAPLAYVVDEKFNFYWYSAAAAKHSVQLRENPRVAIAVFNSTISSDSADGLQISGLASEVQAKDLDYVVNLYFKQSFPDLEVRMRWQKSRKDFEANAPLRFYVFVPDRVFKCDLDNLAVDSRVEVDLKIPIALKNH